MRSRSLETGKWENYYHFDITFPDVSFDQKIPNAEPVKPLHHAHLYPRKNEIELRIFFEPKSHFGHRFGFWIKEINLRKFGCYIQVSKENQNEDLIKLDFSNSALIGFNTSTDYNNGKLEFIRIYIDRAKFFWKPEKDDCYTGDFFLSDNAFNLVSDFYATLFGNEGEFKITRMNDSHSFFKVGKSEFRPEFDFGFSDSRSSREAAITKTPKIHFRYHQDITNEEAFFYADLVNLLASFYFHFNINFRTEIVRLSDCKVSVKRIHSEETKPIHGNLWSFGIHWTFNKFLQSNWQESAIKNFKLLSQVIRLFNQSFQVDDRSTFLIRYSLIEMFAGQYNPGDSKFRFKLREEEVQQQFDRAFSILLQTIEDSEHEIFSRKWKGMASQLTFKPIENKLKIFLQAQNIPVDEFQISLSRITQIRNNLSHGSIEGVSEDEIKSANMILYRVCGSLTLNLLGITGWKFDTAMI